MCLRVSAFTETSDPGDQDGAARFGPLHPAANVLGSVRSAGTVHPADFFSFFFPTPDLCLLFKRKTTHLSIDRTINVFIKIIQLP